MPVEQVDPHDIEISELNERKQDVDIEELKESIADEGILHPPLVRSNENGTYEAFIGQRRVMAAQELDFDEILVIISDRDDKSALKASIVENIDLFSESVSSQDRANALDELWNMIGGEGFPSATQLAEELQVPESTMRTWLEPLRDEWQDTSVDPTAEDDDTTDENGDEVDEEVEDDHDSDEQEGESDDEDIDDSTDYSEVADDEEENDDLVDATTDREPDGPDAEFQNTGEQQDDMGEIDDTSTVPTDDDEDVDETEQEPEFEADPQKNLVDELGERKLRDIRQMTGGGDEGEEIAKQVAEEGLTNKQIERAKTLHERGHSVEEAIDKVTEDESDDAESSLTTDVVLTGDVAEEVKAMAESRQTTESEVINDIVTDYVESFSTEEE